MRRILPVFFVSIMINLFLFLMMNQMVTGEKLLPGKRVDFQGIEFIRFKHQTEPPTEKMRTPAKLPVLQKHLFPKLLPLITKKPAPKLKKLQQIQPGIEPIKPLLQLSRKPYLGDFVAATPPPPVKVVPLQKVTLAEIAEPVLTPLKEIDPIEATPKPKKMGVTEPVVPIETTATGSKDLKEADIGQIEIDVVPLIRVSPRYPRRAVRARLEGIVTIEFTVTKNGSVQNPFIVKSAPPNIFDQSALRAIQKWKFSPKQIAGKPVIRHAIQHIRFRLKKGR